MSYSVAQLKTDITAIAHGNNINTIFGIDSLIDRAARAVAEDVDPNTTIRVVPVTGGIFDNVFDYAAPTDLKGDRIIDIRTVKLDRSRSDRQTHYFGELFDASKGSLINKPTFTVQFNRGQRTLRIQKDLTATLSVAPTSELTGDETWTASGSTTNIFLDTVNYIVGSSAVRLTLPLGTATTNGVQVALSEVVDLSTYADLGSMLAWVYLPTGSSFASVTLRWGSSSSDYFSRTVTTANNDNAFQDGWNLLRFPWDTSVTSTGTPDDASIDFALVNFTYTSAAAVNGVRVNAIIAGLPDIYETVYYSGFLFQNADTGAFQETVTDDTNLINLATDSYNLLVNKCAVLLAQQLQGSNANFDSTFFREEYDRSLKRYKEKYKGEVAQTQNPYYEMPPKRARWTRIQF